MTTDPLRNTDLADPQAWNAYAYVRNNPLIRVDPTGLKDKIIVLQTLPLDQQQPLKKIVERVKDTSKKVEVTNRATKKEIQAALKKADSTDIVVMFGHANPQGFETHGGLLGSTGTITTDELKGSFTGGATCVIGGCRSDSLAAAAAGGGARAAFGFSEDTNAGLGARAVLDLVSALAHGSSFESAKDAGNAALNSPLNLTTSEVILHLGSVGP